MRQVLIVSFFALAALASGCRSHKETVKGDSVSVHQVHSSHTLQQFRDSTSASDSFCIDMQNVKIFVFQDSMVASQGSDTAQDSGSPAGFFPAIIANMMGNMVGSSRMRGDMGGSSGRGMLLSADNISISRGKGSTSVKESVSAKNDSSARDSSRLKVKSKVVDKPPSGWKPMFWILGIFAVVIVAEYLRNKYKK